MAGPRPRALDPLPRPALEDLLHGPGGELPILGYLGVEPTTVWGEFPKTMPLVGGDYIATWVARVLTVVYFSFFVLMPWDTARDKEKPEPTRVTW